MSEQVAPKDPTKDSVAQKLARVMLKITALEKSGTNTEQRYKYAPASAIYAHVRPLLAAEGLVVIPMLEEVTQSEAGKTSRGTSITQTIVRMNMHVTDGSETLEIPWYAESRDFGDKGFSKCMTSALKYFLVDLLLVSTQDEDPDTENIETPERPTSSTSQSNGHMTADTLHRRLAATGLKEERERYALASQVLGQTVTSFSGCSGEQLEVVFQARRSQLTGQSN